MFHGLKTLRELQANELHRGVRNTKESPWCRSCNLELHWAYGGIVSNGIKRGKRCACPQLRQSRGLDLNGLEQNICLGVGGNLQTGDSGFSEGLVSLELCYAVVIKSSTTLWPMGVVPLPSRPKRKRGCPPRLLKRDKQHQPLTAKERALCLNVTNLRRVNRREGTSGICARGSSPCVFAQRIPISDARKRILSNGC
jgi:hypothetical protein